MDVDPSPPPATRKRQLTVQVFGATRTLGELPTQVHSDALTAVTKWIREATGRGRPVQLAPARMLAVDTALREGGVFVGGADELAGAISRWHHEQRQEGDAEGINIYYDAFRAEGYTRALVGPQETLTLRCAELVGVLLATQTQASGLPGSAWQGPLVLDLGCGSGLSMRPLSARGCAAIGIDLSIEMLREARRAGAEVVQADASTPLPIRSGCFDALISVSALQFLCEPAAGRSPAERLGTCFTETARVLQKPGGSGSGSVVGGSSAGSVGGSGDGSCGSSGGSESGRRPVVSASPAAAFQFHPAELTEGAPTLVADCAHMAGCAACLVMDHPHRTSARRWFAYVVPCTHTASADPSIAMGTAEAEPASCRSMAASLAGSMAGGVCASPAALCAMHAPFDAACLLSLREWAAREGLPSPRIEPAHEAWLTAEHARAAHRMLRRLRRAEAMALPSTSSGAEGPADAASSGVTCAPSCATAAEGPTHGANAGPKPGPARRKRKDKGMLAPSGEGAPPCAAELTAARALRAKLGIAEGQSLELRVLQERIAEVLDALHS